MIKSGETFVQIYDEVERKSQKPVTDVSANITNEPKSSRPPKSLNSKANKPTVKPPTSAETRNKSR
jgi:hypothetical protein